MGQGGHILAAGRARSKKEKNEHTKRNPAAPKHTTKFTAAGDRDHLETASDETRLTR